MVDDVLGVIRAPLHIRVLVPLLSVAAALLPWMLSFGDGTLLLKVASPLMLGVAGLSYYFGSIRYHTVSDEGFTAWDAAVLPGEPPIEVASLRWTDVDAVSLRRPGVNPHGVQFSVSGLVGDRTHVAYYPPYADPGLVHTSYILDRVRPSAVSPEVVKYMREHGAA